MERCEDRGHELVLRPKGGLRKLSWEETAREMMAAGKDWSDWDPVTADGLDLIPWEHSTPGASPVRTTKFERSALRVLLTEMYGEP